MKEKIQKTKDEYDDWVCLCGNTPDSSGFYAVNENLEEVPPTEPEWTTNHYACRSCGRIIDADTREVIRQVPVSDIKWAE